MCVCVFLVKTQNSDFMHTTPAMCGFFIKREPKGN